jgi:hypothetical protein
VHWPRRWKAQAGSTTPWSRGSRRKAKLREASLLAELLARRAGISGDTAWGYLIGGQEQGLALLGRMARLGRPAAARLIAEFGALSGASIEDENASFDRIDNSEIDAAMSWWRLPAGFRAARTALGVGRG